MPARFHRGKFFSPVDNLISGVERFVCLVWFGFSQDVVLLKAKHGVPTACPKAGGGGLPPFKALAKGIFMDMQASERILFVYALCCTCLKILALHAPSSAITSQLLSIFWWVVFYVKKDYKFLDAFAICCLSMALWGFFPFYFIRDHPICVSVKY